MKSMKWMAVLFVAAGMMTISSCSDDEEASKEQTKDGSGVAIKSITDKNGNAVTLTKLTDGAAFTYYYDDFGKLTKVIWGDGTKYDPTLFSSPFTGTFKQVDGEDTMDETLTVTTNSSGYISAYKSKKYYYDSKQSYNYSFTEDVEFRYDSSDQLTFIKINRTEIGQQKGGGSLGDKYLYELTLTWENGNIKKVDMLSSKNGNESPSKSVPFYFTGGTNAARQMPMIVLYDGILEDLIKSDEILTLIPLGLFGKGPANLPSGAYTKSDGTLRYDGRYGYEYSNDK